MSELLSLSRPYAEAVFAIATADKSAAKWQELLENLAVIMQDLKMQELVASPKITVEDLAKIFHNILQTKDEKQQKLVDILLENNRMHITQHILEQYIDLCNTADNIQAAIITSAHLLTDEQQKAIVESLRKKTGTEINASFKVDSSLIGGLTIKVKDKIIDKSIKGMLLQMKNQMTQTKDISYGT